MNNKSEKLPVSYLESVHKELCKGASGAGVRTLVNYLLEQ